MATAIEMPVGHCAAPIEARVDSIAFNIEPASRRLATVRVRALGSAIEAPVDAIPAPVRAPLDAVAAIVEALLDAVAARPGGRRLRGHRPTLAAHQTKPQTNQIAVRFMIVS